MDNAKDDDVPFHRELDQHRDFLFRYARRQLANDERAEDAVQETLLAAFESRGRFSGEASIRTWLIGILKHKIVDSVRRHSREALVGDLVGDSVDADEEFDALFAANGHWREPPSGWGIPERAFESRQFWEVFERCNRSMPESLATVFSMREALDMDTEEICKALGITPTNCHVLLHRARMRLRQCLDKNWFGDGRD